MFGSICTAEKCTRSALERIQVNAGTGQSQPLKRSRGSRKQRSEVWSGGEFFDPSSPRSVPREFAQKQFLLLASELYGVTADLRDNVFSLFAASQAPSPNSLKDALKAWCDRYRLSQPWVLRQVKETLDIWTMVPELVQLDGPNPLWHPLFAFIIRRPRPSSTTPFTFTFVAPNFRIVPEGKDEWQEPAGWDLELERKEEFAAEAIKQFKFALKQYCADQERIAKAKGWKRVKRSRARFYDLRSYITWTVQRRCGRMSFEDIAEAHIKRTNQEADVSSIIKRTKEISELIELDSEVSFEQSLPSDWSHMT